MIAPARIVPSHAMCLATSWRMSLQGYLPHKKLPTPIGPPQGPKRGPTVGSYGAAVSSERGTPVVLTWRERVFLLFAPRIGHFGEKPRDTAATGHTSNIRFRMMWFWDHARVLNGVANRQFTPQGSSLRRSKVLPGALKPSLPLPPSTQSCQNPRSRNP